MKPSEKMPIPAAVPVRVQVNFDPQAIAVMDRLAAAYKTKKPTRADVLRDALSFYEWARKAVDEGLKVGAGRDDKLLRQVVPPFDM
jgi:hypothetical protein